MFADARSWWLVMCVFSALNIAAWFWTAHVLKQRKDTMTEAAWNVRRMLLLLAAGYTLGCAWRSVMPVYDVPRIVLFDTVLSSVLVGRSVATVAELCFAAQWALVLRESGASMDSPFARTAARCIFPMIVVAEICSWYSVLTTSNLGHTFENSLWGLSAALVVTALVLHWWRVQPHLRRALALLAAAGAAYVAYLAVVDVPMYFQRWLGQDSANFLSLWQGLADVSQRWTVSADWSYWHTEVTWMTLYFTAGVWASIGLVHLPVLRPRHAPVVQRISTYPRATLHGARRAAASRRQDPLG